MVHVMRMIVEIIDARQSCAAEESVDGTFVSSVGGTATNGEIDALLQQYLADGRENAGCSEYMQYEDIQRTTCSAAEFTLQSLAPICGQMKGAVRCAGIICAYPTVSPVVKAGFRELAEVTKSMLVALAV
ncbi:unnamed protein product [Gongylonema pulchrum]|uniref:2-hydroxyacyl-CoA dehydratase n=1 Tax=Gongylonema pulchrum TaxID=637853 RepID=A0A183EEW1_9BILA|nr:unnamed protein product [Gongylonema pulchrum]